MPDLEVSGGSPSRGLCGNVRETCSPSPGREGGKCQPRVTGAFTWGDGKGPLLQNDRRDQADPSHTVELQGPDALHAILRGVFIRNQDRKTKQTPKHKVHWAQSPPPRELTPNVTCFQVACSPAEPLCGGSAVGPSVPCPCPCPQGRGQPRKPTSVLLSFTSPAGP